MASLPQHSRVLLETLYLEQGDRILATLIGLLHNFDLAEEMMHEAFAAALTQWEGGGAPENPRAWIVSAARNKAVDRMRRDIRFREKYPEIQRLTAIAPARDDHENMISDDRLRLIFTCCHPALPEEAQIALTLRTLCGLTTEEIARVFLVTPQTMAQRLVRVQRKILDAGIPYYIPPQHLLAERLDAVLTTVYLIFTAGYSAISGAELIRKDLCGEAIRLARVLLETLPQPANATVARALLALMLFHDSRRQTRTDTEGNIVLLPSQDRGAWNQLEIDEGLDLLETALRDGGGRSRYGVEASIAALHATARRPEDTDWPQIVALYEILSRFAPSPVVDLNAAVAVSMVDGPDAALERLAHLARQGHLGNYHLLPATQAQMLEKLNRWPEACEHYRRAIALVQNEAERRFLERRLADAVTYCPATPSDPHSSRSAAHGFDPGPA